MHLILYLVLGALTSLTVQAQTTCVGALQQALVQIQEAYSGLIDIRSDCVQTLMHPFTNQSKADVAREIREANDQLDIAAELFVPKVACASISAVFIYFQGNVTEVNEKLQGIACSTAVETQVAAKANANALRSAISDQIPKIDLLGTLFAKNNACNNKQSTAALTKFANAVKAVDASDKRTAQAFTLLGGTLGCVAG